VHALDFLIEHSYDDSVFEALAAAVDEVEIPPSGEALSEVLAIADRLAAKVALALGAFDATEGYEADGATSTTAWLRHHDQSSRAAARLAGLGRRLHRLPVTARAWADGSLSAGQVDAIVANVAPTMVELFAQHEAEVVPALVDLSVPDVAAAMAHWARCAEALDDGPEPEERNRSAHLSRLLDGRVELDAHLDPELGAVVETALRMATTRDADGEPARTPGERRADALGDVCRFFLDHQARTPGGRHRPHVNVVIDLEALLAGGAGEVLGGPVLDGATLRRLCCDAGLHRVITAGRSGVLDYGTTTRTVPAPLWSALVVRDRHCRFPGCDRPSQWGEAHHVVHWADGGPTRLANLVKSQYDLTRGATRAVARCAPQRPQGRRSSGRPSWM
jgi:hypothetical protein